ncbi:MAG TPA: DUF3788 domain-containing protein [Opitutaceae bacterium]
MSETSHASLRLTGDRPPDRTTLARWIGAVNHRRWLELMQLIATRHPGVFTPEWLYGGARHGWSLRYKRSRSFCTFVPEKGRFLLLIVLGKAEQAQARAVLPQLKSHARADYAAATFYPDGKWLLIDVDHDDVLADVLRLLAIKRRPKPAAAPPGATVLRRRHTAPSVRPEARGSP